MKEWKFNPIFIGEENEQTLRDEYVSLLSLLEKLMQIKELECIPIDDVPQDLGLELVHKSKKIAELFCDSYYEKTIHGEYMVYSILNDFKYTQKNTDECFEHFNNYIKNT